ncbi:MAG TPA: antitoxin, RHH family protein [Elusimicrobia bacterium]|nr:antitoxin, RHH family protein [Elusimicrobiota bacterium]HBT60191.1 antitoxin, RHH family protein [Elusimicrobiota bacterium]
MPSLNPRVNVVLEKPLFLTLKKLATKDGVSLSTKVRDLIREALEEYEEAFLVGVARERAKTFKRAQALTHKQVWK